MAFGESLYYLVLESCQPVESGQTINKKHIPITNDEKHENPGCVG